MVLAMAHKGGLKQETCCKTLLSNEIDLKSRRICGDTSILIHDTYPRYPQLIFIATMSFYKHKTSRQWRRKKEETTCQSNCFCCKSFCWHCPDDIKIKAVNPFTRCDVKTFTFLVKLIYLNPYWGKHPFSYSHEQPCQLIRFKVLHNK